MANWNVSKLDNQVFVRIIADDDKDLKRALKMLYDVDKFRNPSYGPYKKKLRKCM